MNDLQLLIQSTFATLHAGQPLDREVCNQLVSNEIPGHQAIAICTRLVGKDRTAGEDLVLDCLSEMLSEANQRLLAVWSRSLSSESLAGKNGRSVDTNGSVECEVLRRIARKEPIGGRLLTELMRRFVANEASSTAVAAIATAIVLKGLSESDQHYLTQAIVATGTIIDLRAEACRLGRRLVRRYPTGGVSEKVALILPTVVSHMARFHPVAGTFLVGRTMSFTGGTWDKLSVIPGFVFPDSADEIAAALRSVRVAMCTTGQFVAPADRRLYMLRSETGTVQSLPLICSSIASKHLALPAHEILFDVRYGPASFAETVEDGQAIADGITSEFRDSGTEVRCVLQSTDRMNGSAIGNVVELAEALATMGAKSSLLRFDSRGIRTQRELVARQASSLIAGEDSDAEIYHKVINLLNSGKLIKDFMDMAIKHGADRSALELVCSDPGSMVAGLEKIECRAKKTGNLVRIDQRAIGTFVNFALRDATSDLPGQHRTGFVVKKWPNDQVSENDVLGICYIPKQVSHVARTLLAQLTATWFEIK